MSTVTQPHFKDINGYLYHFASVKRQTATPVAAAGTTKSLGSQPVYILDVDIDGSSSDVVQLAFSFSDGTQKIVAVPTVQKVEEVEDKVEVTQNNLQKQNDALTDYIKIQNDAVTTVLQQLSAVGSRVEKIEQVV